MSKYGSVFKIDCVSCGKFGPHNVTFAKDAINHLHCMDCGTVNAFSVKEGAEKKTGSKKGNVEHLNHEALTKRRRSASPQAYAASQAYTDGQYLKHPKFGEGYVLAVGSPPTKMEVLFADGRRVLVCGPGSSNGAPKEAPLDPLSISFGKRAEIDKSTADGWKELGFLHSEIDSYANLVDEEFTEQP